MLEIISHKKTFDFMSRAPLLKKVSITAFIIAILLVTLPIPGVGLQFGLDFSGGHEILVSFSEDVDIGAVRTSVNALKLGDAAVQSFEIPDSPKQHFLVRVQRTETFGEAELAGLNDAFQNKYGDAFKAPIRYNPEAGDVVEVEFVRTSTADGLDVSDAALTAVVEATDHKVRLVRRVGRQDQHRYAVVLMGVDVSVISGLKEEVHESAHAERVEFVGPTVGKQLRDDGILACLYALLCILIYIALRFDFFYGPGAIVCLFHDAIITAGLLSILGHEFSLASIAGLLTLIGYSINDTIVVYDRIRERIGKAAGAALPEVLNRAINETLGRTLMTSITTGVACLCLMWFGRTTVLFDFGLIMGIGVLIGTYSSIYVASPVFMALRQRFAAEQLVKKGPASKANKPAKATS